MKEIKPTVFIITSTHNQLEDTRLLLNAVRKQIYRNLVMIIVDDGSVDNTKKFIMENYPEFTYLRGDGNLWWTGSIFLGVNHASKRSKSGDFILTINNDCTIEENYIELLIKVSQNNNRSIVGSLVIDNKDKESIIDAGVWLDWSKGEIISVGPKKVSGLPKGKRIQDKINTLSTKGTLYPVEVFGKIGNFDKLHLPHYASDYEFACRAKKEGFNLLLSYESKVYNDVSRTGMGEKLPLTPNIKEIFKLLFSRRSRINIVDHFWFITLSCPKKYRLQNYLRLIGKLLYLFKYYLTSILNSKSIVP